ncbi:transcriptional regulator, GntR family [Gemmobacter megaterium]|uniref:Transcriptional regulator, GntR family n=1 Tax=Gemmobacter megaterium TaxID=1086013 RepID=A0A1N7N385_9RHOB|nr:FCD domain-containing protein [Gemmobacter megaterium]GGE12840.1 GntR family transcriptional regulator [Gemmobacter megaterium]SIS92836.1 transcriptional regulator, GntR family [Gemmobacter megaterium]
MNDLTDDTDLTLAERAALRLQREILAGAFAPGDRLGVVELARQYGMGTTPVREGLSRLLSQGLIVATGRRGFRVSEISRADLADLTALRAVIEIEGARLSFASGNDTWEAEILATLHRMRNYVRRAGIAALEGNPDYDALHKGFHMALIGGCASPRLLDTASTLYDQAYRYRRLMMRKLVDPDALILHHEELAEVALARDLPRAAVLIRAHLETTLRYVYPEPAD